MVGRKIVELMRAHEQSRSPVPKVGDKVETYMANLLNIDIEANLTIAIEWKTFICAKPVDAKRVSSLPPLSNHSPTTYFPSLVSFSLLLSSSPVLFHMWSLFQSLTSLSPLVRHTNSSHALDFSSPLL